jgi:hypothetical protein
LCALTPPPCLSIKAIVKGFLLFNFSRFIVATLWSHVKRKNWREKKSRI